MPTAAPLRVVVADDERPARSFLLSLLRSYDDVVVVGEIPVQTARMIAAGLVPGEPARPAEPGRPAVPGSPAEPGRPSAAVGVVQPRPAFAPQVP